MSEVAKQISTKQKHIEIILREIPFVDIKPYSHNIINLELSVLADNYGEEEAKKLIKNTQLKNLGWGYLLEEN